MLNHIATYNNTNRKNSNNNKYPEFPNLKFDYAS